MNINRLLIVLIALLTLVLGGCVSSGTYKIKEEESLKLSKNLDDSKTAYKELQDKFDTLNLVNKELMEKGDAVATKAKKLSLELAAVKQENEKLIESGKAENLLKALADRLSELQSKVTKLKAENELLKKGTPESKIEKQDTLTPFKTEEKKTPLTTDVLNDTSKDAVIEKTVSKEATANKQPVIVNESTDSVK